MRIDAEPTHEFQPARWLPGGHAQTIWPALFRPPPAVALEHEPFLLADGDRAEGYWGPRRNGPLVLVLHGLGGHAGSAYVRGLLAALADAGFQGLAVEGRGAGARPNRSARFYHAAAWEDPDAIATRLRRRHPRRPIHAVGLSLGGSIVLNWLLATQAVTPPDSGVAVSTPFDLAACADQLACGSARVYQAHMLRSLRRLVRRKRRASIRAPELDRPLTDLRSLRAFDDQITAPLHGFRDAADYYARASTSGRLHRLSQPVLLIQARNDPFIPATSLPAGKGLPAHVVHRFPDNGGHVGFVTGPHPFAAEYWLEQAIPDWLLRARPDR